ncbi:MAG: (2Fe-2S)-binding protein [Desulfobacteraceae bacterium]|nr:(2Fe-2S)-binding protein [Desulfobacteraceae bacterium]
MITFQIDNQTVEAKPGWTVLETAKHYGFEIPTLCHHEAVTPSGACRLCMVELREGDWSKLVASCIYPVADGINVFTDTERVRNVRRWILEMLLSECPASKHIQDIAARHGVSRTRFPVENPEEQCMLCGLCTRVCEEVVGLAAISTVDRGIHKKIGAPFLRPSEVCVACGCCVTICPTDAMQSRIDSIRRVSATQLAAKTSW